jgi:hypothetical protein
MVNQQSDNDCRPESAAAEERRLTCPNHVRPAANHKSRVTSSRVAAFPSECYDLVFHDPC